MTEMRAIINLPFQHKNKAGTIKINNAFAKRETAITQYTVVIRRYSNNNLENTSYELATLHAFFSESSVGVHEGVSVVLPVNPAPINSGQFMQNVLLEYIHGIDRAHTCSTTILDLLSWTATTCS